MENIEVDRIVCHSMTLYNPTPAQPNLSSFPHLCHAHNQFQFMVNLVSFISTFYHKTFKCFKMLFLSPIFKSWFDLLWEILDLSKKFLY